MPVFNSDHAVVRTGLKETLEESPGMKVGRTFLIESISYPAAKVFLDNLRAGVSKANPTNLALRMVPNRNRLVGLQTFTVDMKNQLTNAARSGTLTVAGATSLGASSVTVAANGGAAVSAARYADNTFARTNVSLLNGNNTFTAIAQESSGRLDTNAVTVDLFSRESCGVTSLHSTLFVTSSGPARGITFTLRPGGTSVGPFTGTIATGSGSVSLLAEAVEHLRISSGRNCLCECERCRESL